MKITQYNNKEEWLGGRKRHITGTRVGDLISANPIKKEDITKTLDALNIDYKKSALKEELFALLPAQAQKTLKQQAPKKIEFYRLIAERVAIAPDGENPRDRGERLEPVALNKYAEESGKEIDSSLVIWHREDNEFIAVSPDGFIKDKKGKIKEAVECKCLESARHIEAYLTKQIPDEYYYQKLQYFIVNPDLEVLHFVFFDDRMPQKLQFFVFDIYRKDIQNEIDEILAYEQEVISQVNDIVNDLTDF